MSISILKFLKFFSKISLNFLEIYREFIIKDFLIFSQTVLKTDEIYLFVLIFKHF